MDGARISIIKGRRSSKTTESEVEDVNLNVIPTLSENTVGRKRSTKHYRIGSGNELKNLSIDSNDSNDNDNYQNQRLQVLRQVDPNRKGSRNTSPRHSRNSSPRHSRNTSPINTIGLDRQHRRSTSTRKNMDNKFDTGRDRDKFINKFDNNRDTVELSHKHKAYDVFSRRTSYDSNDSTTSTAIMSDNNRQIL